MKNTLKKIGLALGILMVAWALLGLSRLDDALANGQQIAIEVPGDDILVGFYYPGTSDHGHPAAGGLRLGSNSATADGGRFCQVWILTC